MYLSLCDCRYEFWMCIYAKQVMNVCRSLSFAFFLLSPCRISVCVWHVRWNKTQKTEKKTMRGNTYVSIYNPIRFFFFWRYRRYTLSWPWKWPRVPGFPHFHFHWPCWTTSVHSILQCTSAHARRLLPHVVYACKSEIWNLFFVFLLRLSQSPTTLGSILDYLGNIP